MMMPQTVLPFKLEITNEKITAHAGLIVFGEFLKSMTVPRLLDQHLPGPGSGVGYQPSRFVEPLLLMLSGGGRTLEDLRQIRRDAGLCELLGLDELPSTDAVGDWLRRQGVGGGLEGLAAVNRQIVRRALNADEVADYTLDIDATQIEAEKRDAKWTYKGARGYMPIVGHLAENGLVLGDEFRQGNDAPQSRNLEFVEYCEAQMPKGKRVAGLRADSAAYQARIFNWCEKHGVQFAIGADLDAGVKALIQTIPEADWRKYQDGFIAETVHSMNQTDKAFRLVVIRRPAQMDLLTGEEKHAERYHVIASNREETAEKTVAWYNQRGEASENRIKELKIGFGMERMPCGDFGANAMFFRIGTLAYNLFVLFKQLALSAEWKSCQVRTLRWRLYQAAGKVVRHAGQVILKVQEWVYEILEEVRTRSREIAFG